MLLYSCIKLPQSTRSDRRLLSLAFVLLMSFSCSSVYALKLVHAGPPTLEEASFIITSKNRSDGTRKVKFDYDCENCPEELTLTDKTRIKDSITNTTVSMRDLMYGLSYNTIYISYNPVTLSVYRMVLK